MKITDFEPVHTPQGCPEGHSNPSPRVRELDAPPSHYHIVLTLNGMPDATMMTQDIITARCSAASLLEQRDWQEKFYVEHEAEHGHAVESSFSVKDMREAEDVFIFPCVDWRCWDYYAAVYADRRARRDAQEQVDAMGSALASIFQPPGPEGRPPSDPGLN